MCNIRASHGRNSGGFSIRRIAGTDRAEDRSESVSYIGIERCSGCRWTALRIPGLSVMAQGLAAGRNVETRHALVSTRVLPDFYSKFTGL